MLIGGYISSKLTPIRLVVGAWCLLTLVLLNVYNGILISYVTATRQARPLINSIDDVIADPNILLVLNRGLGADVVFSVCMDHLNICCYNLNYYSYPPSISTVGRERNVQGTWR
jgi:hypothetical protein